MSNFFDDLLKELKGEECLGVVLGKYGWESDFDVDDDPDGESVEVPFNELMSLEEAKKYMDYKYSRGYGLPECHSIYAWTPTRVISVYQYDGSTSFYSLPRNPMSCVPSMVGG